MPAFPVTPTNSAIGRQAAPRLAQGPFGTISRNGLFRGQARRGLHCAPRPRGNASDLEPKTAHQSADGNASKHDFESTYHCAVGIGRLARSGCMRIARCSESLPWDFRLASGHARTSTLLKHARQPAAHRCGSPGAAFSPIRPLNTTNLIKRQQSKPT